MIWITIFAILAYAAVRWYLSPGVCRSRERLDGKTVIVTGANSGIGLETARDLAERGARVLLACRDVITGSAAADDIRRTTGNGNVAVYYLNLANMASIRTCARKILQTEQNIHVLINNAGVFMPPRGSTTDDGFELQMGCNHLGHFLLTNLLLDRIRESAPARVVNVSSVGHMDAKLDVEDILSMKGMKHWEHYPSSKLANILFTNELSSRLQGTGVAAFSLHPGVVNSGSLRYLPAPFRWIFSILHLLGLVKSAKDGAQTSIYCAVQEGIEKLSGSYFSDCAVAKKRHPLAHDEDAAKRLWTTSANLVKLNEAENRNSFLRSTNLRI